jgi:biopolymer transport protein ExbB
MSSAMLKLYHEAKDEHGEFQRATRSGLWLGLRRGWKALFYRDSMKIVLTGLASFALSPGLLAQSAEPTPAAEFMKRANLWQVLQAGGPAMIPLGILSVITLMLVIAFLFSMRRGSIVTKRFMQTADALIRKRDFLGLLAVSNRHNEAIARVVQRMMNFLTKNPKATIAEIREIAQTEGIRQASALNQQVAYLADIGTISPMVGLLGTVIGIVRSFGVIAIDAAATRPTMLAQGIGEALIATAAGLLIGIPAMAAYAFFRGRALALISDLEAASTQLLALLSTIGVKNPPTSVQAESVEVS